LSSRHGAGDSWQGGFGLERFDQNRVMVQCGFQSVQSRFSREKRATFPGLARSRIGSGRSFSRSWSQIRQGEKEDHVGSDFKKFVSFCFTNVLKHIPYFYLRQGFEVYGMLEPGGFKNKRIFKLQRKNLKLSFLHKVKPKLA